MRSGPLRSRSKKRARQERLYRKLRDAFLVGNPWCAVCGDLATQVHHKAGRRGDLLCDVAKWLPVCDEHHRQITESPAWAIEQGWSLPRIGLREAGEVNFGALTFGMMLGSAAVSGLILSSIHHLHPSVIYRTPPACTAAATRATTDLIHLHRESTLALDGHRWQAMTEGAKVTAIGSTPSLNSCGATR